MRRPSCLIAGLFAALLAAGGCSASRNDGAKGNAGAVPLDGDAAVRAKNPDGSGKPTDESEGIPGYLTDPGLVTTRLDEGARTIEIAAPAGAVASRLGSAERVRFAVYRVPRTQLAALPALGALGVKTVALDAQPLGIIAPAADGSLRGAVACDKDCILVFVTVPVVGDKIIVRDEMPEGLVVMAAKDVATDDPVMALVIALLSKFFDDLDAQPQRVRPSCWMDLPVRCHFLQIEAGKFWMPMEEDGASAAQRCQRVIEGYAGRCGYPPGTTVTGRADEDDGSPATALSYTVAARSSCTVTLPSACPAAPHLPLTTADDTWSSADDRNACAGRPAQVARYCRFPRGAVVQSEFKTAEGAKQAFSYRVEDDPAPVTTALPPVKSECEALPGRIFIESTQECHTRVDAYNCWGKYNGVKYSGHGWVRGDGLPCMPLGFSTANYAFTMVGEPGQGLKPIYRYAVLQGGTEREILAHAEENAEAYGWERKELFGYHFDSPATDPRLRSLYRCYSRLNTSMQSVGTSSDCGHEELASSLLGYGFYGLY